MAATAVARDVAVGALFERICFVGVGQNPDFRELQRSLHQQLTEGGRLDPGIREEQEVLKVLREVALRRSVLLLLDDAWTAAQLRPLSCLDPCTSSRILVTTRISGLVPGALVEFSLGLLDPESSIRLLLEVSSAGSTGGGGGSWRSPVARWTRSSCSSCRRIPQTESSWGIA